MTVKDPWSARRQVVLVMGLAFALRLAYGLLFVDPGRDDYWEYGELARNLRAGNGYALFHAEADTIAFRFSPSARPVPSAYMPPGYVAFLYPFLSIDAVPLRNLLLITAQALLGSLVVGLVFVVTRRHVQASAAVLAAVFAACLPEFIYAAGSATPTILYHAGILMYLIILGDLYRHREGRGWVVMLSLVGLLLMSLRAESAGLVILTALFLWKVTGWRRAVLFAALVGIGYMPWLIRTTVVFGEPVALTTSGGLNLFRGHNPEGRSAWSDDTLDARLAMVPMDSAYEPTVDALYRQRVREIVAADPWAEPGRAAWNVMCLWLVDPADKRSGSMLYVLPWLALLGAFLWGVLRVRPLRNHIPLLMVLAYTTALAAIFFVLPRYQTMMKVILVPFAAVGAQDAASRFVDFLRRKS